MHPTEGKPRLLVGGHAAPDAAPRCSACRRISTSWLVCCRLRATRAAAAEPARPAPPLTMTWRSAAGRRAVRAEVTDRLLEPLLGGVYAGYARRLSFDAVGPRALPAGEQRRFASGARPSHRPEPDDGSGIRGVCVGGVSIMVDSLVDDLAARRGAAAGTRRYARLIDRLGISADHRSEPEHRR